MGNKVKNRLLTSIEQVPESKLGELLDFTEFLLEKERHKTGGGWGLDPGKDPILKFIGGVAHGSLAKDIDGELYGEKARSSLSILGVGLPCGTERNHGTRRLKTCTSDSVAGKESFSRRIMC